MAAQKHLHSLTFKHNGPQFIKWFRASFDRLCLCSMKSNRTKNQNERQYILYFQCSVCIRCFCCLNLIKIKSVWITAQTHTHTKHDTQIKMFHSASETGFGGQFQNGFWCFSFNDCRRAQLKHCNYCRFVQQIYEHYYWHKWKTTTTKKKNNQNYTKSFNINSICKQLNHLD